MMTDRDIQDSGNVEEECREGLAQDVQSEPEQAALFKQNLEELQARYTRLAADFENHKKRTERQAGELVLRANQNLICDLLPVMDNFLLALETVKEQSVFKGIRMIYDQLSGVLENAGLVPIQSLGSVFDPTFHEAVAFTQSCEDSNTIVEEIRRGYTLGGKVIRPAMVKVNIVKEEN